jgi:hypothetical protein
MSRWHDVFVQSYFTSAGLNQFSVTGCKALQYASAFYWEYKVEDNESIWKLQQGRHILSTEVYRSHQENLSLRSAFSEEDTDYVRINHYYMMMR